MNNLVIIGNGFDLAHSLKTSYNHFINHIIDSHIEDKDNFKTLINTSSFNINTKEQRKEYAQNTPVNKMEVNQEHILSSKKVINIHEELNSIENPIIFGFAANNEESRKLIEMDDKEYMRYIKKHCYKRTDNESNLKFYLDNNKDINVFILGHSCGISDKLILNEIFNHKNIDSIRVFYHEEIENYFEAQVNIDRIMNNDSHFKKLKSFQSSIRMPQINDTDEQINQFNNYIETFIKENTKQGMSAPKIF